jgi:bacterioferritin (cytochrome b1)
MFEEILATEEGHAEELADLLNGFAEELKWKLYFCG